MYMHVCVHVHICMYTRVYACVLCAYVCVLMGLWVCACTHLHVHCEHVCICIYMHLCVCVRVHTCADTGWPGLRVQLPSVALCLLLPDAPGVTSEGPSFLLVAWLGGF